MRFEHKIIDGEPVVIKIETAQELAEGLRIMKSLDQHNAERRQAYADHGRAREPHSNNIACPTCSKELWDSNPTMTLTSNPPQKNVHCPACGYVGYRIA